MNNSEQILYTTTLKKFVDAHLGRRVDSNDVMWHSREIDKEQADIIFALTQNKHTCYIEFNDEFSKHLVNPILWDFNEWHKQSDRHTREQAYSHKQRIERFLLEANMRTVTKALCLLTGCEPEQLQGQAFGIVHGRKWKMLSLLGITKLKEQESEL
jgi:hypothetical protein